MAVIDVGTPCITRTLNTPANYTRVARDNPANLTGTIDYICIFSGAALTDQKVASFINEGGDTFSTRADVTLANQGSAGLSEYNAPGDFSAFSINSGDYLGHYHNIVGLKYAATGGTGIWYGVGDHIPASSYTFPSSHGAIIISLYATGTDIIGWTGKMNGVTNPAKIMGISVGDIAKVNGI